MTFSAACTEPWVEAPQLAISADRDRQSFRFTLEVVVWSPLFHSLWSWRLVVVFCGGLARRQSGKSLERLEPYMPSLAFRCSV
jgi:hypothetical protein